jgi:hypothetical protein
MKFFLNQQGFLKVEYKFGLPQLDWFTLTCSKNMKLPKRKNEAQEIIRILGKYGFTFEAKNELKTKFEDITGSFHINIKHNSKSIQFKGTIFVLCYGKALDLIKKLYIELNERELKQDKYIALRTTGEIIEKKISGWKCGRIDVKTDYVKENGIIGMLPIKSPNFREILDPESEKYHFGFKSGQFSIFENEKHEITGWRIISSTSNLVVYRKDIENQNHKNKLKKTAYDLLLRTHDPIVRVELQFKTPDVSKRATEYLQKMVLENRDFTEQEICEAILSQYAKKHKVYKTEDYTYRGKNKVHAEEERWKAIFIGKEQENIEVIEYQEINPIEAYKRFYKTAYAKQLMGNIPESEISRIQDQIHEELLEEKTKLDRLHETERSGSEVKEG